jgi:hypothetical protein
LNAKGPHRVAKKRKTRAARLRTKRARRIKYIAAAVLLLLIVGDLLPLAWADVAPERPSSNFGVEKEIQAVQDKRNSDQWAGILRSEAEGKLNSIGTTHADRQPVSIGESVVLMSPNPPVDPEIYSTIEQTTLPNRTTLIDFLIGQPMSYEVYTKSNGVEKWTAGLLRPSLTFNLNGTLVNWDKWAYVNVDDNNLTGESHGYDVRVRIDIQMDSITPVLPHLFPLPIKPAQIKIKGGVKLEVEKLSGPDAITVLPLEVFIVKSYSFQGTNYLWTIGMDWKDMPNTFKTYLTVNEFTVQRPTFDPNIDWTNILNSSLFDTSNVVNISGPYDIDITTDTRPAEMGMTVGYAKVQFANLTERTWANIQFTPAAGMSRIAEHIHVHLESPNFNQSFNELEWKSSVPIALSAVFKQVASTTTYLNLLINDIPTDLKVALNVITGIHGERATNVAYEANDNIKSMDFTEYEFYDPSMEKFTHSHLIIKDLPKVMDINGTFDIGGPSVMPPDNLAIGFPARFMDNVMLKISSKFYTVAQTIRTIPNNIIHMPERKGYTELTIKGGEILGSLEFYVSSKSRVEADGNYIAFRNDSTELGPQDPSGPALVTSSLSGRLTDIEHVFMDFSNGTILDLALKEPRPLNILFIDDGNDAKAVLALKDIPGHFYLKFHPDAIKIQTDSPLALLTYTSLVGSRYFRLVLEALPTDLTINQKGGRMVLRCGEGQSLGAFSMVVTDRGRLTVPSTEYNHIFLDRSNSSYLASIRIRDIKSLDMQTAAGGLVNVDFAKERDLYIDLTDSLLDVQSRMLFSPFPSNFSIELPRGFITSGIRLPNVLNVSSLFAFSPMILQMDQLSGDIVKMTTELTDNIATTLGSVGTNTTIKLRSKVPTTLIADLRKGPADEIRWVHGVNVAIDNARHAIRGRIYLRLPLRATINMLSEGDIMDVNVDFKDYTPIYPFLDIRVTGMSDKDVALFLDGFPQGRSDFKINAHANINMTPGHGVTIAKVNLTATQDLGPMYMNLRKLGEFQSLTTLYTSTMPKTLDLNVDITHKISITWKASGTTKNVYLLMQKKVRDKWYDVTATVNKVPTDLRVEVGSALDHPLDMDGSLLQGLPAITVMGLTTSLSMYLYVEGPALGQPQTYEIRMGGITAPTTTTYDETDQVYRIRSLGLGYLYMRIIDMPYTEKFQMSEAEIYADEIYSMDLKVDQVFGTFPIVDISNVDVSTFQFRIHGKMDMFGQERNANFVFVDLSSDGGLPRSTAFTKNGLSITGGDHHAIMVAPIATLLATLLGGR